MFAIVKMAIIKCLILLYNPLKMVNFVFSEEGRVRGPKQLKLSHGVECQSKSDVYALRG